MNQISNRKKTVEYLFLFTLIFLASAMPGLAVQSVIIDQTGPMFANVTDTVSFSVNVTNNGTEDLNNSQFISIFDPAALNYTTSLNETHPGFLNDSEQNIGEVYWTINLSINESALFQVNFTAKSAGNTTHNVTYENSSEGFIAQNSRIVQIAPSPISVALAKTIQGASTVDQGDNVSFLINVTNTDSVNFTNFELLDEFDPSKLNYSGHAVLSGAASPNLSNTIGGEIFWTFNLTTGTSLLIEVNFTTPAVGFTLNNVSVENNSIELVLADANVTINTPPVTGPYTTMWSNAQPASFFPGNIKDFYFSGAPYVARGDGCYRDPQYADNYSSPGENCCSMKDQNGGDNCGAGGLVQYDLGAVWVDQVSDFIGWWIVGPTTKGNNNLSVCDGTNRSAAFVVEFDIDNNQSSGCMGNESCYPGSDYQIWFFPDSNETLFSYYTGQDGNGVSFTANTTISADDMWVNYNCSATDNKKRGIGLIVNKTAAFPGQNISLNFETNSFNTTEANTNPIDLLTDTGGFSSSLFSGPAPEAGACFQFDNVQASCENNSDAFSCRWTDFGGGNGLCDPDFQSFSAGASCFQYGGESACTTDANNIGYCRWESNVQQPNGSIGLCVEEFKPFEFGGTGSCDTSCGDCFTQNQCTNSDANGGQEYGGCSWYNDTFNPAGWCGQKDLAFGCSENPEDCLDSATCGSAGWGWNETWRICLEVATDEVCFNSRDDDGNGDIDCEDSACENSNYCGVAFNTLTGDFAGLEASDAAVNHLTQGIGGVLFLAEDNLTDGAGQFTEITGFAIAVATYGIGMGIMTTNLSDLSSCGGATDDRQFIYGLDTDANASSGCNITIDGSDYTGLEYVVRYGNFSVLNESGLERYMQACYNNDWISRNAIVFPPIGGDPNIEGEDAPMECAVDSETNSTAAVVMLDKADIGNPTGDMRFIGVIVNGSVANLSNLNSYDIVEDAYYTPGTQDFTPVDCFQNPTSCGAEFMILGGGEFMPLEDCIMPGDEDANGFANCADDACAFAPHCAATTTYNPANDKTAPKVKMSSVDKFNDFAVVRWVTGEPTNGSIKFYATDDSCAALSATYIDSGLPNVLFDDFKPWHDVPIESLSSSTSYYYKIVNKDKGNNTATSKCLNFTTTGAATNVTVLINFTPVGGNESDFLGDLGIFVNDAPLDIGSSNNVDPSAFKNVNVTFKNPNASADTNWSITLVGADFTQAMSLNFNDMFIANQTGDDPFVGIESSDWNNIVQKLGVDHVELTIPQTGDQLFHCADDGTNCTDVSEVDGVSLLEATPEQSGAYSTWKVPTTLGFSSYSAGATTYILNFTNSTPAELSAAIGVNTSVLILANNTMESAQEYNFSVQVPVGVTAWVNGSTTLDEVNISVNQSAPLNITFQGSTEGTFYISVIATLSTNSTITLNSSDDLNITLTVPDTTDPVVNLSSPVNNSFSTSTSVSFVCNATDNVNLQNITLNVYNGSGATISSNSSLVTGTSNSSTFIQTLSEGAFSYGCFALDASSNSAFGSENRTFTVDATDPVIVVNVPATSTVNTTNSTPPFNFTATDNIDTNLSYTVYLNDSGSYYSIATGTVLNGSTVLVAINQSNPLADGTYEVSVELDDDAGNTGTGGQTNFTVDTTAPSVAIVSTADGYDVAVNYTLTGTVSDATTGVSYVEITRNGTAIGNATVSGSTWEYNVTGGAEGDVNNITAAAYDFVANNATDTITGLTLDATEPVLTSITTSVTTTTSTVTWTSDEAANASVAYGTTTALGTSATDTAFGTSQSVALSSLTAATLYYYNVTSCDRAANCNTSGPNTFTTSTATTSGGGGGGGGSSSITSGSVVTTNPQRVSLSTYGSHYFQVPGDKLSHSVRINKISGDSVTFIIRSEPILVTLKDGASQDVDVTGDGTPDVTVKLISHTVNQVSFTMGKYVKSSASEAKSTTTSAPTTKPTTTDESNSVDEVVDQTTTQAPPAANDDAAKAEQNTAVDATDQSASSSGMSGGAWLVIIIALLLVGIGGGLIYLSKRPDALVELRDYLEKAHLGGHDHSKIKRACHEVGWHPETVDKELEKIKQKHR